MLKFLEKIPLWGKFIAAIAVSGIIIAVYWFGWYTKNLVEIQKLEKKRDELAKQLADAISMKEDLKNFKREYTFLENKLELTLSILPKEENMNELVVQLESLATRSGLTITKFDPTAKRGQDFYYEYPIKLVVEGGYHELAYFCMEVANLERIVNLSNLLVKVKSQAKESAKGGPSLVAEMEATAFAFKSEEEVLKQSEAKEKKPGPAGKKPAKEASDKSTDKTSDKKGKN
jgi:type IV pilus assembly protein PilO